MRELPPKLKQEVKDFVERAKSLPLSYFEAKAIREVDLSEFSHVLAQKSEINNKQKQALEDKGIKVVEYKQGEFDRTIQNLDTKIRDIYSKFHQTGLNNTT